MKAGQQLVFGEQIGWISPKAVTEGESGPFFRDAVQLRYKLRRYFYEGEMARPPKLLGEIPTVKADWQWNGEWWVTTDAVLTGAWRLPATNESVLIFANVSDAPVTATLHIAPADYGFASGPIRVEIVGSPEAAKELQSLIAAPITFPSRNVSAWILRLMTD